VRESHRNASVPCNWTNEKQLLKASAARLYKAVDGFSIAVENTQNFSMAKHTCTVIALVPGYERVGLLMKAAIFVGLFTGLSFFACSTAPSSGVALDPSGARYELTESFKNGFARLECQTSCAGSWGAQRQELKGLHDAGLWTDLATKVLKVGFRSDQTYYYLGKAAEGLGYTTAAEIYYRLSITSTNSIGHKCDGVINNCDGLVFPQDAESRLQVVLQTKKEASRQEAALAQQNKTPTQSIAPETTQQQQITLPPQPPVPLEPQKRVERSVANEPETGTFERAVIDSSQKDANPPSSRQPQVTQPNTPPAKPPNQLEGSGASRAQAKPKTEAADSQKQPPRRDPAVPQAMAPESRPSLQSVNRANHENGSLGKEQSPSIQSQSKAGLKIPAKLGNWRIERDVDKMTDKVSCTAYYIKDAQIQLTAGAFFIGLRGRGGAFGRGRPA